MAAKLAVIAAARRPHPEKYCHWSRVVALQPIAYFRDDVAALLG
jgi:hypothetical protein